VPALSVNHVSVHATDLEQSTRFYVELFGMTPIPTPNFGFPVRWLSAGAQQLHLFVRDGAIAPPYHHLGLNVEDFEAVYRRIHAGSLADGEAFHARLYELPGGAVQMYIRDPAGNLVEIDWPSVDTLSPEITREITRLADIQPQRGENLRATLYHSA